MKTDPSECMTFLFYRCYDALLLRYVLRGRWGHKAEIVNLGSFLIRPCKATFLITLWSIGRFAEILLGEPRYMKSSNVHVGLDEISAPL